jgi:hypothetical protein
MKARKGGNRLERLKNLCEVHGVLLDPEHPSNELVIDCNGNKYTVDRHFNMKNSSIQTRMSISRFKQKNDTKTIL